MVPTVDSIRYNFLLDTLIRVKRPVLLTGPVGTGKTSVAQKVLESLDMKTWSVLTINMSAQVHIDKICGSTWIKFMENIYIYMRLGRPKCFSVRSLPRFIACRGENGKTYSLRCYWTPWSADESYEFNTARPSVTLLAQGWLVTLFCIFYVKLGFNEQQKGGA